MSYWFQRLLWGRRIEEYMVSLTSDPEGRLTATNFSRSSLRKSGLSRLMLFLCSAIMFAYSYGCDLQAATRKSLIANFGINESQFGVLVSAYNYPNVILPLLGGMLVDGVGLRVSFRLFSAILAGGMAFFVVGAIDRSFEYMVASRLLYGVGGESLCIATSAMVTKWFDKKSLPFALAVMMTFSRLGSFSVYNSQSILEQYFQSAMPGYLLTLGLLLLGMVFAGLAGEMDLACDRAETYAREPQADVSEGIERGESSPSSASQASSAWSPRSGDSPRSSGRSPARASESSAQSRGGSRQSRLGSTQSRLGSTQSRLGSAQSRLGSALFGFPTDFYFVAGGIMFVTIANGPFGAILSTKMLGEWFDCDTIKANFVTSLPTLVSCLASPFVSRAMAKVDRQRYSLLALALSGTLTFYSLFALLGQNIEHYISPAFGLYLIYGCQGLCGTLYSCLVWPVVSCSVASRLVGTAYGFVFVLQNLGLCFTPWLVTEISQAYSVRAAIGLLAGLIFVALCFHAILAWRHNKSFELNSSVRESHEARDLTIRAESSSNESIPGNPLPLSPSSNHAEGSKPLSQSLLVARGGGVNEEG